MIENKENDLLFTMIDNPNFTFEEMLVAGLSIDNTSLNTREAYKLKETILEMFKTVDGGFDEEAYNKHYDKAVYGYNVLVNNSLEKSMEQVLLFDKDNIYVTPERKRKDLGFTYTKVANPFRQTESMITLGRRSEVIKSFDEIAQGNKVLANPTEVYKADGSVDWDKAVWHEAPENDMFEDFWDTRVMAQYDTDGTHIDPITGEIVSHKAGDLRLNEQGTFYYENLDGRDVYGRRVLNKLNTITKEDSKLNKYDFFDSDDLELKNFIGNTIKNLFLVGTMFIPYVGPWVAGASVLTQSVGLLGTLGKMLLDSENETFSAMEGWSKSVNRQNLRTQYAQDNMWCWENFVNLIGDVAGLLREQRFIFDYAPAVFKGTKGISEASRKAALKKIEEELKEKAGKTIQELIEQGSSKALKGHELYGLAKSKAAGIMLDYMNDYNKIGSILSKAYMTAVTVGDTYGEAKLAGATDEEAMWLTLGYAAGELAILNSPLGEWIMPELRANSFKFTALKDAILKGGTEAAEGAVKKSLKRAADEGKKQYAKRLFNVGKNVAKKVYSTGSKTLMSAGVNALSEGFEEVTEELLADFSKQCFNWYKKSTGDPTVQMEAWKDPLSRYAMSFVGGAIGGGLAHVGTNYKTFTEYGKMDSSKAMLEMIYMARNEELDKFERFIDKNEIGHKSLSATKVTKEGFYEPGTEDDNLDLYAKKIIKLQIKLIKDIVKSEGAALSDDTFLDIQTRGDLRLAALADTITAGRLLLEFNTVTASIATLAKSKENLYNNLTDKEHRTLNEDERKLSTQYDDDLEEQRKKLNDLVSGKRSAEFLSTALFEVSTYLRNNFMPTNFLMYAEYKLGKKLVDMSDKEKQEMLESYENYVKTEMKDDIATNAGIFHSYLQEASEALKEMGKFYEDMANDPELMNLFNVVETSRMAYRQATSPEDWLEMLLELADSETSGITLKAALAKFVNPEYYNKIADRIIELDNISSTRDLTEDELNEYSQLNEALIKVKPLDSEAGRELSDAAELDAQKAIYKLADLILDKGYINSVVKNKLLPLMDLELGRLLNATSMEVDDWGDPTEEGLILSNLYNELRQKINAIQKLPHTPVEQFLDTFSLTITGKPVKLTEVIDTVEKALSDFRDDITAFTMTNQTLAQINNALLMINLFGVVLQASRTDNADLDNLFGYSAILNQVNKGEEGWKELTTLDSNIVDPIFLDLNVYVARLELAKQLFEVNSGQTLSLQSRVGNNTSHLLHKKLQKFIVSIPPDEWEGVRELNDAISAFDVLGKGEVQLNEEQAIKLEEESKQMLDIIYTFFEKNSDKLKDPKKLAKLLRSFNLFSKGDTLLTDSSESLDDLPFIWWMCARAAVKASSFYYMYKQVINEKSAPLPTLELALYLNYASIVKSSVFENFQQAFNLAVEEEWKGKSEAERVQILINLGYTLGDAEMLSKDNMTHMVHNIVHTPMFTNTVLTEGIPGSGKTTGVYENTMAMLRKFNPEKLANVVVLHTDETKADNLGKNCKLKSYKSYSYALYLEKIIANYKPLGNPDKNGHCDIEDYTFEDGRIKGTFKLRATSTAPTLIVIDEVTKLSQYELEALSLFAKQHNIQILTAGDYDQSGVRGKHKLDKAKHKAFEVFTPDTVWNVSTNRRNFCGVGFKLGVSMRTNNKQAEQNDKFVQQFKQKPKGTLTLHYYQDETGLYGDKLHLAKKEAYNGREVISDDFMPEILEDVELILADLLRINKERKQKGLAEEKLTYVYNDENSKLYKEFKKDKYKDLVDFKYGSSAQGDEGSYYITDLDPSIYDEDDKSYWDDFYTAISRRSKGSLIITRKEYKSDKSDVTYSPELDASTITKSHSPEAIKAFYERRKKVLDTVYKDGEAVKSEETTEVKKAPEIEIPTTEEELKDAEVTEEAPQAGIYEGVPVTGTDIIQEDEFKELIDNSSQSQESTPQVTTPDIIKLIIYSFNTFELGMTTADGKVVPGKYFKSRIDSVNGLMKLPKFSSFNDDAEKYTEVIKQLRNVIFNTTDKIKLSEGISKILGIENILCTFGIKTRANSEEPQAGFWRHFKEKIEKLLFINSKDTKAKEIPQSTLSLVVSDGNVPILELPLFLLTNPYTLMLTLDNNGNLIYPEAMRVWTELGDAKFGNKMRALHEHLKNTKEYPRLYDLITIYLHTQNDFFKIEDENWTIARNLKNLGPQFAMLKGLYDDLDGRYYEADWVDILKFSTTMKITPVLISRTSQPDGIKEIKAGHPFVLMCGDTSLSDDVIVLNYLELQKNPNLPKTVKLVYVLPPKASIESYIDNLFDIINNKGNGAKNIGDITTSYKLLKVLLLDERFVNAYKDKFNIEHVILAVSEIKALEDSGASTKQIQQALYEPKNWSEYLGGSTKPVSLSGLFDGVLKNFVYLPTGQLAGESSIDKNVDNLHLIENVLNLNGIDGVYYSTRIPVRSQSTVVGIFDKAIQLSGWSLEVRPGDSSNYQIHGKVDSYAFLDVRSEIPIEQIAQKVRRAEGDPKNGRPDTRWYENNTTAKVEEVVQNVPQLDPNYVNMLQALETLPDNLKNLTKDLASNYYSQNGMSGLQEHLSLEINSSSEPYISFILNDKLVISESDSLFSRATLWFESEDNQRIQYKLVNSGSEYSLIYSKADKQLELRSIEVIEPQTIQTSPVILAVTDENLDKYKQALRMCLGLNAGKYMRATSAEELITLINEASFSQSVVDRLKTQLSTASNPEAKAILLNLIDVIGSDVSEESDEALDICKPKIIKMLWQ